VVRQAHTYLAGAVSGTALVGAAVAAFVLLVSLQALRDWPLAGIGFGDSGGSVEQSTHARGAAAGRTAHGGGAAREAGVGRTAGAGGRGNTAHGGAPGLGRSPSSAAETPGGPGTAPAGTTPTGTAGAGSAPGGGSGSGSGSGSGGGETGGSGGSVSGTVTGTANETVSGVDQATGGALGEAGVTEATKEAVNGLAGPESTVGKTIDGTAEAAGGVPGTGH
jgi:hypothetical protein